jgi:hypothetical protein
VGGGIARWQDDPRQFSGECEIATAFFVAASGGRPTRAVTGPYTRANPPEDSVTLGWTTDGRAIVFVPAHPGCGGTEKAGVYLVALSRAPVNVASVKPREQPRLKRLVRARTVESVARHLRAG